MSDRDEHVGVAPMLPGYQWIRHLGSGGFADVYLCRQEMPSRDVAVKIARLDRGAEAQGGHRPRGGCDGARVGASGCRTVVRRGHRTRWAVFPGDGVLSGREHHGSGASETDVDGSGAVDDHRMCGGAEMLHRVGFVHRDIKPSNIMVNAYGSPVLTDFGVAEHVGTDPRSGRDGFRSCGHRPSRSRVRRVSIRRRTCGRWARRCGRC